MAHQVLSFTFCCMRGPRKFLINQWEFGASMTWKMLPNQKRGYYRDTMENHLVKTIDFIKCVILPAKNIFDQQKWWFDHQSIVILHDFTIKKSRYNWDILVTIGVWTRECAFWKTNEHWEHGFPNQRNNNSYLVLGDVFRTCGQNLAWEMVRPVISCFIEPIHDRCSMLYPA